MYNPLDRIRKVHLAQLKPFYRYEGLPMATDIKFDVEKHIQKYEIPETELVLESGPSGGTPLQSLENPLEVESDTDFTAEESADEYLETKQCEHWENDEMPQNSQKVDTVFQKPGKSQKYDTEPIKINEIHTRYGRRSRSPNRLKFMVATKTETD